jgi:protein pelota
MTTTSDAGSTRSERVHTTLTIKVTKLDFDAPDSKLQVAGKVAEANQYVPLNSFHTLDLELNRPYTLAKAEGWDSVAVQQLKEAVDSGKQRAMLWAIMMQEGVANICYVTEFQTKHVQHVTSPIPKKRSAGADSDKATRRFYILLFETMSRHMELNTTAPENLPPVLLASPGFTAQNFLEFVKQEAARGGSKTINALVKKITITHSSSANLQALAEVMKSPAVTSQLRDTKFARESQLLDEFYASLRRDDGKAWYGPKEILQCVEKGAVGRGGGVLLISNNLFRNQNVDERKKWVALVDRVRDVEGGEVRVLSEAHESGKRLEALGGIAALLSYPIYDLEDDEEGEDVTAGE